MDEHLMERIIRVERENRRLKWGGLAVLLVLGAVFLLGQAAPKKIPEVLEARSFQVVHTDGKVVAALGTRPHGTPTLTLRDRDGKLRANLHVAPDGAPGLRLWDKDRKIRAALVTTPDGTPSLEIRDTGSVVLSPDSVVLTHGKNEVALRMKTYVNDVVPALHLVDTHGKLLAFLGLVGGEPRVRFDDKEGKPFWYVYPTKKSP